MKFVFDFVGPRQAALLLAIAILLSIADLFGIAIIFPYLRIIAEPELMVSNPYLHALYQALEFQSQSSFVYGLSLCLLLIFTVKTGVSLWLNSYQLKSLAAIAHDLASELFGMLLRARYDYFLGRAPSELLGMTYPYAQHVSLCFQAWLGMVTELIFFLLLLGTCLYIKPLATSVVALSLAGLVAMQYLLIIRRIVRYGREGNRIEGARHRWTFATVSSIKDLKIMGLAEVFYQRTVKLSEQYREIAWRTGFANLLPKISIEYVIISAFVVAAVIFMRTGMRMENLLPLLGLMALASLRILPAFGRLSAYYSSFRYSKTYLDKLEEFHAGLLLCQQEITHVETTFSKSIEIRHLNFSYGAQPILQDLSLVIDKGRSVGIVGASGSGKSTLLDIITGLQEKRDGQFLLDGREIDPYATDAIRQHVGYVPQQISLIDESVAFNIAFVHNYDRDRVESALRTANLYDFVASLPEAMTTSVGESGVRLSGGQRQRMGIARALYRNPDILIFDESTSALDNITEQELSSEIHRLAGQKTLIIVAHRLTTIMGCDVIYVMDHGRIVASGTHAELIKTCALYRDMNAPTRHNPALEREQVPG